MVVGLIVERGVDRDAEVLDVVGDEVRQVGVLGVAPHRLDWVEFRAVGGQVLDSIPFQPFSVIRRSADRCTLQRSHTTISGRRTFRLSRRRKSITSSVFTFLRCTSKQQPTRVLVGKRTTAPITLSRSRRSHERCTGVQPSGAQVRRFTGWSMKPVSSRKTMLAPRRRAFF